MEKKRSAADIFKEQQTKAVQEDFMNMEEIEQDFDEMPCEPKMELQASLQQNEINGLLSSVNSTNTPSQMPKRKKSKSKPNIQMSNLKTSEEMQLEKEPLKVRITGKWFWQRVIVPPNAYVVHTRIKKKQPVTIGLGISFRYKPKTDAFLIVPAAMQTIGVVANSISKEKQGINVLAYVQWQIDDFAVAYKKLDFSDSRDPLGIVNAQLREQAEAAIKDKIATMSVEDVLTDKAPVIEELTSRLKKVAEGQENGKGTMIREGLGIKITTVQIREAFVSSTSLWEDLQSPFRYEQKQKSSISYLQMQKEIKSKELETIRENETKQAETNLEIEQIKQTKQTEIIELKMNEEAARYKKEQETIQEKFTLEETTVLNQKEMQNRIKSKESQLLLQQELEKMQQADKKAEEEAKISLETQKREIQFKINQQIFKKNEENKLEELLHKIHLKQIELNKVISNKESDLNLLVQKHSDQLKKVQLEANMNREKELEKSKLKMDEERNKAFIENEQQLVKIERIRQEIDNLINTNVVLSQLVAELPEIASKMPEIKELKVLQMGEKDASTGNLASFLTKILSLSDSLGKKLPFTKDSQKEKK